MGGTLLLLFNLQNLPQPQPVEPGQAEGELSLAWGPVQTDQLDEAILFPEISTWEES
jgi:hypothetical protein